MALLIRKVHQIISNDGLMISFVLIWPCSDVGSADLTPSCHLQMVLLTVICSQAESCAVKRLNKDSSKHLNLNETLTTCKTNLIIKCQLDIFTFILKHPLLHISNVMRILRR